MRNNLKMKKELIDSKGIDRALTRIAHEIIENNKGTEDLALIGIRTRGVPLSGRLVEKINDIEKSKVASGILDITLYRDDLSQIAQQPIVHKTEIPFDITSKKIVLIDDVIYTGRTARAAMDALIDMGRPRLIQLAVIVDRGHRELPIRPDYIGKNLPTSREEVIKVNLVETDGEDKIYLMEQVNK